MGEDLKITKNIAEDNINITKVPITETKTLEIQLTHEEILIERRPVNSEYHLYNHVNAICRTKIIIIINRRTSGI